MITLGLVYQHYKGDLYRALHFAGDSNNDRARPEVQVVYQRIADGQVFVRSLDEFEQRFRVA